MRPLVDRERLDRFMIELGRAAREPARVYLVGGATALLHKFRAATIDIDLRIEPETTSLLKSLPEIKERLSINVEMVSPLDFLPELPDWRERSRYLRQEGPLTFYELDFYAQALAKIERGHERDLVDVRAMLDHGLVEPAQLRQLFAVIRPELYRFPAIDPDAFAEDVERALSGA